MTNLQEFGQRVAETRKTLPAGVVFITSVENYEKGVTGGAVCEANPDHAARRIVAGTHRVSHAEEIASWKSDQQARERECRLLEEKQKEKSVLALTPEMAQAIGLLGTQADNKSQSKARP